MHFFFKKKIKYTSFSLTLRTLFSLCRIRSLCKIVYKPLGSKEILKYVGLLYAASQLYLVLSLFNIFLGVDSSVYLCGASVIFRKLSYALFSCTSHALTTLFIYVRYFTIDKGHLSRIFVDLWDIKFIFLLSGRWFDQVATITVN